MDWLQKESENYWYRSIAGRKFKNGSFFVIACLWIVNAEGLAILFHRLRHVPFNTNMFFFFFVLYTILHYIAAAYMWKLYIHTREAIEKQTADEQFLYAGYIAYKLYGCFLVFSYLSVFSIAYFYMK